KRSSRLLWAAGEAQNLAEIGSRLPAQIEEVGSRGERRRLAGEALGLLELPRAGQELRPGTTPADLGIDILRHGETLRTPPFRQQKRFLVAPLPMERIEQMRHDAGEKAQLADLLEVFAHWAQLALGHGRVACEQLDLA